MNRHPNKPYRQKWHMPKLKSKLEGGDIGGFFLQSMSDALGSTSRMKRKRLHHVLEEVVLQECWNEMSKMVFAGLVLPSDGSVEIQAVLDGVEPYHLKDLSQQNFP